MAWKQKLVNAGWVAGLRTVDLAAVAGPAAISIDQLDAYVRQNYGSLSGDKWGDFAGHLRGLVALGAGSCGVRTRGRLINLMIGRVPPDGILEVEEAVNYYRALESWLRTLEDILPKIKLSEQEKQVAKTAASKLVGGVAGADVASLAADILIQLTEAGRQGLCLTLHPLNSLPDGYRQQWASTDMISVPALGICNVNLAWDLADNTLVEAKRTGVENWSNFAADLKLDRLRAMLSAVAG